MNVFRFPAERVAVGRPSCADASWLDIAKGRVREAIGRLADRLKLPGLVRVGSIQDELTGDHIEIRTNVLFTVININGRDYWFNRLSGKYDGTGCGCS